MVRCRGRGYGTGYELGRGEYILCEKSWTGPAEFMGDACLVYDAISDFDSFLSKG